MYLEKSEIMENMILLGFYWLLLILTYLFYNSEDEWMTPFLHYALIFRNVFKEKSILPSLNKTELSPACWFFTRYFLQKSTIFDIYIFKIFW